MSPAIRGFATVTSVRGQLWKWLGIAGVAGVAATGALVVRAERQRRAYRPDDIRARLHERAASVAESSKERDGDEPEESGS